MLSLLRNNILFCVTALLATLSTSCMAELGSGIVTADPVKCTQITQRINPPVAEFPRQGLGTPGYQDWDLEHSPPLPDWLSKNKFKVQQRGVNNFYFASYNVDGQSFNTNWIITFRRSNGSLISSWSLRGFVSCNLDHADPSLYQGFQNFVLSTH